MSTVQQMLQAVTQGIPVRCIDSKGRSHAIAGKRSLARHYRNAVQVIIGDRQVPRTLFHVRRKGVMWDWVRVTTDTIVK